MFVYIEPRPVLYVHHVVRRASMCGGLVERGPASLPANGNGEPCRKAGRWREPCRKAGEARGDLWMEEKFDSLRQLLLALLRADVRVTVRSHRGEGR